VEAADEAIAMAAWRHKAIEAFPDLKAHIESGSTLELGSRLRERLVAALDAESRGDARAIVAYLCWAARTHENDRQGDAFAHMVIEVLGEPIVRPRLREALWRALSDDEFTRLLKYMASDASDEREFEREYRFARR
jgi:hypothetical protein